MGTSSFPCFLWFFRARKTIFWIFHGVWVLSSWNAKLFQGFESSSASFSLIGWGMGWKDAVEWSASLKFWFASPSGLKLFELFLHENISLFSCKHEIFLCFQMGLQKGSFGVFICLRNSCFFFFLWGCLFRHPQPEKDAWPSLQRISLKPPAAKDSTQTHRVLGC